MAVSIRLRLALIYTGVFAVVLLVFGVVLHLAVERYMLRAQDEALAALAVHGVAAIGVADQQNPTELALANLDPFSAPGVHVQVLDGSGHPTAHSAGLGIMALPENAGEVSKALAGGETFYTAHVGNERIRVYNVPLVRDGAVVGVLQFGKSYHDLDLTLSRLDQVLALSTLLALVLAGSLGWAVAGRALQPVAEITATARSIAEAQAFNRRLAERHSGDEVGRLALAFDEMLASLEVAYETQRRFVADASHELRAPLTTIRGNLEFLSRARDLPAEVRDEAVRDALAEAKRMGRLVQDLLTLARVGATKVNGHRPVALDAILRDLAREVAPNASHVELRLESAADVVVPGDPDHLKQLALILIDNALKYTAAGGRVEVTLDKVGPLARLSVKDNGLGIDAHDLPFVFERFYRADKARERESGGAGLGLAIAKSIVERHGGSIDVESQAGHGSTFTVLLPCVTPGAEGPPALDYSI